MESYLVMLFVTLEQEKTLTELFQQKGWQYSKPDLSVTTSALGPMKCPSQIETRSIQVTRQSYKRISDSGNTSSVQVSDHDYSSTIGTQANVNNDKSKGKQNDHDYLHQIETQLTTGETDNNIITHQKQIKLEMKLPGSTGVRKPSRKRRSNKRTGDVSFSDDSLDDAEDSNKADADDPTHVDSVSSDSSELPKRGRKVRIIDKVILQPEKGLKNLKDNSKFETSTPCSVCGKLVSARNIARHLKSHQNYPHRCGACSLYFQARSEKDAHDKMKHGGLQFVCSVCGVRYKFLNSLKEHMTLKHEFYKPQFSCSVCGKGFSRIGQREDHMNTHRDSNPYKCKTCARSYNNKSAFNRHTHACLTNRRQTDPGLVNTYKADLKSHEQSGHELSVHRNVECRCKCGKIFKNLKDEEKHQAFCSEVSSSFTYSSANDSYPNDSCLSINSTTINDSISYNAMYEAGQSVSTIGYSDSTKDDTVCVVADSDSISDNLDSFIYKLDSAGVTSYSAADYCAPKGVRVDSSDSLTPAAVCNLTPIDSNQDRNQSSTASVHNSQDNDIHGQAMNGNLDATVPNSDSKPESFNKVANHISIDLEHLTDTSDTNTGNAYCIADVSDVNSEFVIINPVYQATYSDCVAPSDNDSQSNKLC